MFHREVKGDPIRILYVEDNPGDARLLQYEFAEKAPGIEVEWLSTYREAAALISTLDADTHPYDLVLADLNLPDGNGIGLLSLLHERSLHIPLVVVTGLGDEESAVNALKAGATDFVVKKDDYLERLPATLHLARERYRSESVRRQTALRVLYGVHLDRDAEILRNHLSLHAPFVHLKAVSSSRDVLHEFSGERQTAGWQWDVLLLDYQIPGMTAIELVKELHSIRGFDIPVVVISGERSQEVAIQALRLGAHDYISRSEGYLYLLPEVLENAFHRIQVERERAALKASEEHFRMLIENASDLILVIEPEGTVRYASPSMERILGRKPARGFARNISEYLHPADMATTMAHLSRIAGDPDSSFGPVVLRVQHDDGSWRYMEAVGKTAGGSPPHSAIVVNARDITERRAMEEALQESEAKYRGLVESSLVGVFVVQDGVFRFANRRLCEMCGYPYEEMVDRARLVDMVHPDDAQVVEDTMNRLMGSNKPIEHGFRISRKDDGLIHVNTLVSPISYKGRPAAAGTMIDITKERSLEGQLRQAQKMEAIGTLAGGIAHDFNNILTVLTGYGTLLKMELQNSTPSLTAYVDAILSASLKAANLTQSLLAFARQQPIKLKPVNLNQLVTGTKKLLKRLLTEDITLKTDLSPVEIFVMADTSQMDQILFNLAGNARDAMPVGGTLTLETRIVELDRLFAEIHGLNGPGAYALLAVTDTGMGMDPRTKEHIFEPFFTTKEVGKGTGLGLATVYGIVRQHNGSITVYSEKCVGTSFHIHLPLAAGEEQGERPSESPVGGTETILLAEDNRDVRNLMATVLRRGGYTVVEAVDGEDAVNRFKADPAIALLILDSVMPKKNGRQTYDEISLLQPEVKVLFTSGHTRDVVLDKGIEDKKFAFISKPVSPDALLRKVREVLNGQGNLFPPLPRSPGGETLSP